MMSSSCFIMVHIAPGFQELWPFVYENSQRPLSNSNIFYQIFMKLGHIVKYHDVFFKFKMIHIAPGFQELWPFVYENSPFETTSAL